MAPHCLRAPVAPSGSHVGLGPGPRRGAVCVGVTTARAPWGGAHWSRVPTAALGADLWGCPDHTLRGDVCPARRRPPNGLCLGCVPWDLPNLAQFCPTNRDFDQTTGQIGQVPIF